MNLIATGVIAGVLGTVAMDLLNFLFAKTGMLLKIDLRTIGRMAAGWVRGRFCYGHPSEMQPVEHELVLGLLTHYSIGVSFALPFVLAWEFMVGGPVSPAWILVYGIATTVASLFLVYPSMGLGACGNKSPEGLKAPLSSLANHLFFGIGMAVAVALV